MAHLLGQCQLPSSNGRRWRRSQDIAVCMLLAVVGLMHCEHGCSGQERSRLFAVSHGERFLRVPKASRTARHAVHPGIEGWRNEPVVKRREKAQQIEEDKALARKIHAALQKREPGGKITLPKILQEEPSVFRDIRLTKMSDFLELMRQANPMAPAQGTTLQAVTLSNGTRIEFPDIFEMRWIQHKGISETNPVTLHWKDTSEDATPKTPDEYDEMILTLLNLNDADIEPYMRGNWMWFDKYFFWRLDAKMRDTTDEALLARMERLGDYVRDVLAAAEQQTARRVPQEVQDATAIMEALSDDGEYSWPPEPKSWLSLAEEVAVRAKRNSYDDGWFDRVIFLIERAGGGGDLSREDRKQTEAEMMREQIGRACIQRLITEWLRAEALWDETDAGQFIFKLLSLHPKQWHLAVMVEVQDSDKPIDATRLKDELKIISEMKIMKTPMGSPLQTYAAAYVQQLLEFIESRKQLFVSSGSYGSDP